MKGRKKRPARRRAAPDLGHVNAALRPLARRVSRMRPDPGNARVHDERNLETIRASLELHGQQTPIVLMADGRTVKKGSGTLLAARLLGWEWIAAIRYDGDPGKVDAYAVTDNRSAELATWDEAALARIFKYHDDIEGGRDMLPGWSSEDVDALLKQAAGPEPPPEFPEAGEGTDHECPKCGYQWSGAKPDAKA